ncbi:Potassium transporter 10 [Turnera subulata]|uniref:Potassium transporter 10 n=1 Tax=Turnera subulata TaxID=218843 RepID=A0A9Q0FJP0_9ROSI|nr:Potassium transporter 10 [Turnera subulata]
MASGKVEETDKKGRMWALQQEFDQPMDEEGESLKSMNAAEKEEESSSSLLLLQLAFQSLGVVYGDLSTSPLYVFYNTFPDGIEDPEDVIGALSLIIYSLTLIPLLKYVLIVCRANDNGQGGTFALYSLLCRHAKVKTIPNQDRFDEKLTTYRRFQFSEQSFAATTKRWLERYAFRKNSLLIVVLIGSSMVIGDGILTPAISGVGIFNICKYDSSVLKAFSPLYIYRYFRRGRKDSWISLGGTEALFADLSHFSVAAIQVAFTVVVFPCLLLAYSGQAAYLVHHPEHVADTFYRSIPDGIYWLVLIVASGAAVAASQATISATFALVKQALAVDCFPRVKVLHTSDALLGQVYIPDINWLLMILCIAVTAGFKNQSQIGNASGTAVAVVMLVTTFLMTLIMILVWRWHWIPVLLFTVLSLVVEGTYFSAVVFKINQGGWVPLAIGAALFLIMYAWHYGRVKRFEFEMQSKISMAWIVGLGPSLGLVRVPGIGLVYSELARGVPHIFSHFITNLPAIHSVLIFVCIKYLPVHTVPEGERFLVRRIGPKNFHMFRCVARYGYRDLHKKDDDFENKLLDSISAFVRLDSMMEGCSEYSSGDEQQSGQAGYSRHTHNEEEEEEEEGDTLSSIIDVTIISNSNASITSSFQGNNNTISSITSSFQGNNTNSPETDELDFLRNCRDAGVVHMLGNTVVMARKDAGFFKRVAIDYVYALLRKLSRENSMILNVPHQSLLNVGQIIHV